MKKKRTARKKPKRPLTPECTAPGCPLRYRHVLNNGEAYCRYHHGVKDPKKVYAVTKRIHELLPVLRQIRVLNSLNASQILGDERIVNAVALPVSCKQKPGEGHGAWKDRLIALVDDEIELAKQREVVNG
ncbi:MAG: hypothetical protein AB2747_05300 [Candidatus Thiodiazotropha taylori]